MILKIRPSTNSKTDITTNITTNIVTSITTNLTTYVTNNIDIELTTTITINMKNDILTIIIYVYKIVDFGEFALFTQLMFYRIITTKH